MENNENKYLCKECGGKCCKSIGCHLHPDDVFKGETPSFEILKNLLSKGIYAIDFWEGDPRPNKFEYNRVYYIRVANTNSSEILDASWGGNCKLLTTDGCSLSFKDRPLGGKALIPSSEGCISMFTKEECCIT